MAAVLITGASSGIGRATALRLAGAGRTVFAGVRGQAAAKELEGLGGGRIQPLILDVTSDEQIAAAAAIIGRRTGDGGLDALVNNAGIGIGGPMELLSRDDLHRQFDVNVFGQMAVVRAMLPALRKARGRIVLVSSIGGRVALPFAAPYSASKHAIEACGDALRSELAHDGIQVALIQPGSVATPIWEKAQRDAQSVAVPAELDSQYGHVAHAMADVMRATGERGMSADRVARCIERAIDARRMRSRYMIGADAHAMLWAKRLLPDRLFDRIVRRQMGLA